MLRCPNCGAPLAEAHAGQQRTCAYCHAVLQVPAPPTRAQPALAPRSSRLWLIAIPVLLTVAVGSAIATFRAASASAPYIPQAATPQATAPLAAGPSPSPSGIAWNRLAAIDIHATTEQAKALKTQFPEAEVEQDKDYRLNLAHPILNQVFYSWDWGCACLDHVVFFFKDYTTRTNTLPTFIPCLTRELGPAATSAPPFDYDWPSHREFPHLHVGPQTVTLSIERETSAASYGNALTALDRCRQ